MIIKLDSEVQTEMTRRIIDRYAKPRASIHVSDVIYCIRKAYLNKKDFLPPPTSLAIKFALGEALHELLKSDTTVKEQEKDGLVCTVDEIGLELKTSRMSRAKILALLKATALESISLQELEAQDAPVHWLRQMMAYAYVWKRTTFSLGALFINGNYSSKRDISWIEPSYEPTLDGLKFTFTEEELAENWAYLKARGAQLRDKLKKKELPGIVTRAYEWECNECPYYKQWCAADFSAEKED